MFYTFFTLFLKFYKNRNINLYRIIPSISTFYTLIKLLFISVNNPLTNIIIKQQILSILINFIVYYSFFKWLLNPILLVVILTSLLVYFHLFS